MIRNDYWTDAELDYLIHKVRQGYSASQIAAGLAFRSRNSVIGKITRMGLTLARSPNGSKIAVNSFEGTSRRRKPKRSIKQTHGDLGIINRMARKKKIARLTDKPIDANPLNGEGVPFLDRERRQCAWPLWTIDDEPDISAKRVCGNPVFDIEGQPYCEHHWLINRSDGWQPSRRRGGLYAGSKMMIGGIAVAESQREEFTS